MDNSRKAVHNTREAWLMAAVELLKPRFKDNETPLPKKMRVTVSFPFRSNNAIGQHFHVAASADKTHEMLVHPELDKADKVLSVLTHELCHAAAPEGSGHGPKFAAIGRALLLEGKPTAMGGGDQFRKEIVKPIVAEIGKYPHAKLMAPTRKQSTRLLKCQCDGCGYIARVTGKWILSVGAPACPDSECPDFGEQMRAYGNF